MNMYFMANLNRNNYRNGDFFVLTKPQKRNETENQKM